MLDPFMTALLIANGQMEDPKARKLTRDEQLAGVGFGPARGVPGLLQWESLYIDARVPGNITEAGIPSWRDDPGIVHLTKRLEAIETRLADLRAGRPARPPKSDFGRLARIAGLLGDREKLRAAQAREAQIREALAAAAAADDEEAALEIQREELVEARRIRTVDAKAVERDAIQDAAAAILARFARTLDAANAMNNLWQSLHRFAAGDFQDAARLPDSLAWPELARRGDVGFTMDTAMGGGGHIDRWYAE